MLQLLGRLSPDKERILQIADSAAGYLHWTDFRHKRPFPEGITREEGWAIVRLHRSSVAKRLPFQSKAGQSITVALTDGLHAAVRRVSAHRNLIRAGIPENPHSELPEEMRTFGLKALIDEAYCSAVIEGAVSTRKDARRMIREEATPRDHSERMILNNYRAGKKMAEQWIHEPMSPALLCEIQKTLTEETLEDPADWGQFRSGPVHVVDEQTQEVVHTGPDPDELPARIEQLCEFANYENSDDPVPVLVRACLLHYQLAYDHPFGDGNGRTARWLFLWRLLRCPEYWWVAMLSISRMTSQGRQDYYDSFRFAQSDGDDATYLVRHQLAAMEREMDRFARFLTRRRDLRIHLREFIPRHEDLNSRQTALLEHAMNAKEPVYTQPVHRAFHDVTQPTAREDLERLVTWGLLERREGRPIRYIPTELLAQARRAHHAARERD